MQLILSNVHVRESEVAERWVSNQRYLSKPIGPCMGWIGCICWTPICIWSMEPTGAIIALGADGISMKDEVLVVSGFMIEASLLSDSNFLFIIHFLIQRHRSSAKITKLRISRTVSTLTNDWELEEMFRRPMLMFSSEFPFPPAGGDAFDWWHMPASIL